MGKARYGAVFQGTHGPVLKIRGNFSRLRAKPAHIPGHLPLTLSQDGQSLNGYYLGCGVIDKHTIELTKQ